MKTMPNKWKGQCADCGQRVEPYAGLVRKEGDKWVTHHEAGQCPNWTGAPKGWTNTATPAPTPTTTSPYPRDDQTMTIEVSPAEHAIVTPFLQLLQQYRALWRTT